jgi:hypothetical protein
MRKTSHIAGIILALFLLSLATEQSLMAYADPGSGAMFVQILLAGIVGCMFRIRSFTNRFRRWKNKPQSPDLPPVGSDGLSRPSK